MDEIFERFESEILYEQPIKYFGLTLYPVLMKDVIQFNKTAGVLLINPLDFNDPTVASMSYLELMINLCAMQEDFRDNFITLMKIVFKVEDDDLKINVMQEDGQTMYSLLISQEVDKETNEKIWKEISPAKFSKLKNVICFQNGLEVLDLNQNQDIIRTKKADRKSVV